MRALLLILFVASCAAHRRATPETRLSCAGPHALMDRAAGSVKGRVFDAGEGRPIAGVTVLLRSAAASHFATTDDAGEWRIGNLDEGEYLVVMERAGKVLYSAPLTLC